MARCNVLDPSSDNKRVQAFETAAPYFIAEHWATGWGYILGLWMYVVQYRSGTKVRADLNRRPLRPSTGIQPYHRHYICLWPHRSRFAQLCSNWLLCGFLECWRWREPACRLCDFSRIPSRIPSISSHSTFGLLGFCAAPGDTRRVAFAWASHMPRDG